MKGEARWGKVDREEGKKEGRKGAREGGREEGRKERKEKGKEAGCQNEAEDDWEGGIAVLYELRGRKWWNLTLRLHAKGLYILTNP